MKKSKFAAVRPTQELMSLFARIESLEAGRHQAGGRQNIYERALKHFVENASCADIKDVARYRVAIDDEVELPSLLKFKMDDNFEPFLVESKRRIAESFELEVVQFPYLLKLVLKYQVLSLEESSPFCEAQELSPEMRRQVYEVLLLPIHETAKKSTAPSIEREGSIIYSSQQFASGCFDPDMSDVAVDCLRIMYEVEVLDGKGNLASNLASDTLSSFNTVANRVPGAGRTKATRTHPAQWPDYLRCLYEQYHCLANCWLIESPLGRGVPEAYRKTDFDRLSKTDSYWKTQDYMDRFLIKVKDEYAEYCKNFNSFAEAGTFEAFIEKHKLVGSYVYPDAEIYKFSSGSRSPEEVVSSMLHLIKLRAACIAASEVAQPLWHYFSEHELLSFSE